MYYTCLQVICPSGWTEIIMAEVAQLGFESFIETDEGFEAYTEQDAFDKDGLDALCRQYASQTSLSYYLQRVEKENWNEQWEKNYHPVEVEGQCLVRASFHQPHKAYPYEIVITPRMSFGTGHHATTQLMLKNQLQLDHTGLRVMDAGTGTGILAIMAEKRGAVFVDAFDVDEWSIDNCADNLRANHCCNIRLRKGTVQTLTFDAPFQMVLANINKNVLLEEMALYVHHLAPGGRLIVSGFYVTDLPDLTLEAKRCRLAVEWTEAHMNWAAAVFIKP